MKKAERVIAAANEASPPWEYSSEERGDLFVLTLTRGQETMEITWDTAQNDTLVHPLNYSLAGVREAKLRNVSAAIKTIGDKPNFKARRTARPKADVPKEEEEIVPMPLPFDKDESTDRDIVKAVVGKRIIWRNRMLGTYESGIVPARARVEVKDPDNPGKNKFVLRTSKNIRMTTSSEGRRILTFPAVGEQFRSVAMDQIVQVV